MHSGLRGSKSRGLAQRLSFTYCFPQNIPSRRSWALCIFCSIVHTFELFSFTILYELGSCSRRSIMASVVARAVHKMFDVCASKTNTTLEHCIMKLLQGFKLADGFLPLTCHLGVLSPLPVVMAKAPSSATANNAFFWHDKPRLRACASDSGISHNPKCIEKYFGWRQNSFG